MLVRDTHLDLIPTRRNILLFLHLFWIIGLPQIATKDDHCIRKNKITEQPNLGTLCAGLSLFVKMSQDIFGGCGRRILDALCQLEANTGEHFCKSQISAICLFKIIGYPWSSVYFKSTCQVRISTQHVRPCTSGQPDSPRSDPVGPAGLQEHSPRTP